MEVDALPKCNSRRDDASIRPPRNRVPGYYCFSNRGIKPLRDDGAVANGEDAAECLQNAPRMFIAFAYRLYELVGWRGLSIRASGISALGASFLRYRVLEYERSTSSSSVISMIRKNLNALQITQMKNKKP